MCRQCDTSPDRGQPCPEQEDRYAQYDEERANPLPTSVNPATIYTDEGAKNDLRTRVFRDVQGGGVEWMFAVDHACGADRWYGYGVTPGMTIARLIHSGMHLVPLTSPTE